VEPHGFTAVEDAQRVEIWHVYIVFPESVSYKYGIGVGDGARGNRCVT
jgi:hypothetical protein